MFLRYRSRKILDSKIFALLIVGVFILSSFSFSNEAQAAQGGNQLVSIETVTGTTGTGASATASFSNGTALNKMFHFCSFQGDVADNLHDQVFRATALTAIDTLTITAGQTGGSNLSLTYRCYIVIFTTGSDLVVQRFTTPTPTADTANNQTITAVSATNRAFVIPHGESDPSDTTIGSEELWEYQLTSTTNVAIFLDGGNNSSHPGVKFEVVDWNNSYIAVQHINTNSMTTAETTDAVNITAVDQTRTWLIGSNTWSGVAAGSSPTDDFGVRLDFLDSDTIQLRKANSGVAVEWSAQVIEDTSTYGLWKVQAGSIAMSTAETSDTFTLTAVNTANTFVNGTTFNTFGYTGQSSDTTTGNVDSATATVTLTNGTTVTAVRGVTDTTTLDVPVQAVEFLPAFTQSAYRLFNNVDSTDVGTVLADQDTAATLGATGAAFRLRALLHLDTAQLAASGQNFKLQFAQQSGTCDTAFSGETYADVTGATVIAYNNNTPADGDNLTANANDPPGAANPHFGHTIVNQDYEELNNFTNSVAATPRGQDGLWDFSLKDNGATASTAYCLRAVKSDGTVLDTYSVIPQITTAAGATTTLGDGTDGSNSTIGPGASASAFPTVQSLTESIFATDTTAHAVSMPATVNSGDLLLAAITTTSDDDEPATPSGWTDMGARGTGGSGFSLFAKRAAGTEGGTTVDFNTDSFSTKMAAHVFRITGWRDSGTLTNDVEVSLAGGESSTPDPPSFNPTNWDVEDTLWIAVAGINIVNTSGNINGYPSGYTNTEEAKTGTSFSHQQVGSGRKESAAAV